MLQLVADMLTLCTAGTGSGGQGGYNQSGGQGGYDQSGGQGGYGQDTNTGEERAARFRPVREDLRAMFVRQGAHPLSFNSTNLT